ncbi:uncharacterized protein K452DRAFT_42913 [Aplosporella prunicola CBS 121167]|uniref:Uncharacterized protein n=1 Tax=Aplosporella prunicola CBS 121167 TaxID=1176127 RepID=A0A6A6BA77_9PEZI|nr:uncharacterized protein K452DRAFT_42913 [Aplosporella prunicola CBS 121167]KAF2140926.1 hypothetical protein K452DRAFT_42913 [Aplosporella prunicola CBS 121167]
MVKNKDTLKAFHQYWHVAHAQPRSARALVCTFPSTTQRRAFSDLITKNELVLIRLPFDLRTAFKTPHCAPENLINSFSPLVSRFQVHADKAMAWVTVLFLAAVSAVAAFPQQSKPDSVSPSQAAYP